MFGDLGCKLKVTRFLLTLFVTTIGCQFLLAHFIVVLHHTCAATQGWEVTSNIGQIK
jgi:hypothetical protein